MQSNYFILLLLKVSKTLQKFKQRVVSHSHQRIICNGKLLQEGHSQPFIQNVQRDLPVMFDYMGPLL